MYNSEKNFQGQVYTGMKVGGSHQWIYEDGIWNEVKITPEKWKIQFSSKKTRMHSAPENSGAGIGTRYHWYIIADQIATKLNANSYNTIMRGLKFKVGHKRPKWKTFSYNYPEQESYKQRVIKILEAYLRLLKEDKIDVEVDNSEN